MTEASPKNVRSTAQMNYEGLFDFNNAGKTRYDEIIGTREFCLLYQISCYSALRLIGMARETLNHADKAELPINRRPLSIGLNGCIHST